MALTVASCAKEEKDFCRQMDDPVFKAYCLEHFDTDGDGKILRAEAEEVSEIAVPSMEITSLNGIGAFVNLLRLDCSGNRLTSLDLRNNQKLTFLDCRDNLIDVIYINESQDIPELYKTPFLHDPPLLLTVNGLAAKMVENKRPISFEAKFTGENIPESLTWESNLPSFQPVTSVVQGSTVSLSFAKALEIGEMQSSKLYRMYATASDGTRSNFVRFGIFGKDPIIYFEKPRNPFTALVDETVVFSVFFYPGEGENGTPSIHTSGEGCNRSFASGVKIEEDEPVSWNRTGLKRVVVYFEKNGKWTKDTLYVNVVEGLPEIRHVD